MLFLINYYNSEVNEQSSDQGNNASIFPIRKNLSAAKCKILLLLDKA